jgi:predicted ribonuclease toxin of YeeF-YezG toxin-antitoxin module
LAANIRNNSYKKISSSTDKKAHRDLFNNNKASLRNEWESNTGEKWPTYDSHLYSKSGSILRKPGDKYDAHEIIKNSWGGPVEWWNLHPARFPDQHQGGIHRKGSPDKKIFKR